jgi:hypothetical protein
MEVCYRVYLATTGILPVKKIENLTQKRGMSETILQVQTLNMET